MRGTPDPLLEKLTLFFHGHFATSAAKVDNKRLMLAQNELFRRHGRGPFGDVVRAVSRDPAMLVYLDSTSNRRIRPNENYARELLELFCLGVGHYSEQESKKSHVPSPAARSATDDLHSTRSSTTPGPRPSSAIAATTTAMRPSASSSTSPPPLASSPGS